MILSHQHKFVFIKGIKVAGTSAEIALSQRCGPMDTITTITPADERRRIGTNGEPRNYASHIYPPFFRHAAERRYVESVKAASASDIGSVRKPRARFRNHMTLREVLRLVPKAANYELIYVERSPYAKVMSFVNWAAHAADYAHGGSLAQSPTAVVDAVNEAIDTGAIRRVLNIDRYRGPDGIVRGDPWRTDTLAEDVEKFFRSRGLEPVPVGHAKRGFGSDAVDPASVLRPEQIRAINEMFAEEFERFGWPMLG